MHDVAGDSCNRGNDAKWDAFGFQAWALFYVRLERGGDRTIRSGNSRDGVGRSTDACDRFAQRLAPSVGALQMFG